MGLSMRNAIENDLKKIKGISIIIGKHNVKDNISSYLERIKSKIDVAWIVAPETENELIIAKEKLIGKRWIGCEKNALFLSTSKSLTKGKLLQHNILNPDSKIFSKPFSCEYIVKPEDGAGCENTYKYSTLKKALNAQRIIQTSGGKAIIEKFIPGQSMSFSMLCSITSTEVIVINRQIIEIEKNGKLVYRGIRRINFDTNMNLKNKIIKVAEKIREAIPGLKGFVGVDFILDQYDNVCVIEINPRITCAYIGLSYYLNRSLAEEILRICP